MPSILQNRPQLHVAMIMDGNGRWATRRDLPRTAGHRAGVLAVRNVIEAAPGCGINRLTLFAFSSDNWRRPPDEVAALMGLLGRYVRSETQKLIEAGVRVSFIGRRDRLPERLSDEISALETATTSGNRLHVRIALDYSSREAIARAAAAVGGQPSAPELLSRALSTNPDECGSCDVDLLIRTGGEKRLSDFLLWECAYAELWFTDTMWPDFGTAELQAAIADFRRRDRRFGGLSSAA